MNKEIVLVVHNVRSTHNVGSLFRSADCFGVSKVLLSGYSPYPSMPGDSRLPHIKEKITGPIHKTALGAERTVPFEVYSEPPFQMLRDNGYTIVALEQDTHSTPIVSYQNNGRIALILGEERFGITPELLKECDDIVEIPMHGSKESLNVSVAAGIALYQLKQ